MQKRDEESSIIKSSRHSVLSALNVFFRKIPEMMVKSEGDADSLNLDLLKETLQQHLNELDVVSQTELAKLLNVLEKEELSVKSLMQQIDSVLISIEDDKEISPQDSKKLIEALRTVFQTLAQENTERPEEIQASPR